MAVIPSVAAAPAIATCEAIREAIGQESYSRALARLEGDVRDEVSGIAPVGWIRISSLRALLAAASIESGRDADLLMDEAVRVSTSKTFRTIWRVLLSLVSDEALTKRVPMMYSRARNIGAIEVKSVSAGKAELQLSRWPGIVERDLRSVAIATRSILEVTGRREVRCQWSLSADGGAITVLWKA